MFVMDERLDKDTYTLGELPLSRLLLMNDARYPWLILVPRVQGITEVYQLEMAQQQQLWQETNAVAERMQQVFAADKMNLGALGNVVSQLHMHVVARKQGDAAWPAPVWGQGVAVPYSEAQRQAIQQQLQATLLASGLMLEG